MREKKVLAVIGCGRIASSAHFPAFAQMDNVRIKYACDLLIEKSGKDERNLSDDRKCDH